MQEKVEVSGIWKARPEPLGRMGDADAKVEVDLDVDAEGGGLRMLLGLRLNWSNLKLH